MLDEVIENKNINFYKKKQTIFHEGNQSYNVYFVQSGLVKVFKNGSFNKDQIIRFSFEGNILGHRGLTNNLSLPISAKAVTDSEICSFSRDYFLQLLKKIPELTINLMFFLAEELNEEESKLRDMAVFSVREKVAKSLLILIEKFNLNNQKQINFLHLLSRQDIADMVGLTQNQVTKELTCLKNEGLIFIDKKNITIPSKEMIENIIST